VLDEKGAPTVVQRAKMLFPLSQIGAITAGQRLDIQNAAPEHIKAYNDYFDRESAYELIVAKQQQEEERALAERRAKEEEKQKAAEQKEQEKAQKEQEKAQKAAAKEAEKLQKEAEKEAARQAKEAEKEKKARRCLQKKWSFIQSRQSL